VWLAVLAVSGHAYNLHSTAFIMGVKPVSPVFDYAVQQFYLLNLNSMSTLQGTGKHTMLWSEVLISNQMAQQHTVHILSFLWAQTVLKPYNNWLLSFVPTYCML
jgi:hypothetical protein